MRDDRLLLQDIIEASKIIRYTTNYSYEDFISDEKTTDVVIRNLEIIGEAPGRIQVIVQQQNPEVEWRKMKNFHNLLIHDYFGGNYKLVGDIIQHHLPSKLDQLQKILQTL
jgi:uncharacterized protein with HEPN domain